MHFHIFAAVFLVFIFGIQNVFMLKEYDTNGTRLNNDEIGNDLTADASTHDHGSNTPVMNAKQEKSGATTPEPPNKLGTLGIILIVLAVVAIVLIILLIWWFSCRKNCKCSCSNVCCARHSGGLHVVAGAVEV